MFLFNDRPCHFKQKGVANLNSEDVFLLAIPYYHFKNSVVLLKKLYKSPFQSAADIISPLKLISKLLED